MTRGPVVTAVLPRNGLAWHVSAPGAATVWEAVEALGWLPSFLHVVNPAPAREQFDRNYGHGGGWQEFKGFETRLAGDDPFDWWIEYPGDPRLHPFAWVKLRDETICVFDYAWVMIVQPDGAYEIARMD